MNNARLRLLARAAHHGVEEGVSLELLRFDPLMRPILRRMAHRAVEQARSRTAHTDPEHIFRLAYVLCHGGGGPVDNADDVAWVRDRFVQLSGLRGQGPAAPVAAGAYRGLAAEAVGPESFSSQSPPKERYWATTIFLLLMTLSGAVATTWILTRSTPLRPEETFAKTPLGVALGDPLSDYVTREDRERDQARNRLAESPIQNQLGPTNFREFQRVLDEILAARVSKEFKADEAGKSLFASINALNRGMALMGTPALLHGYLHQNPTAEGYSVWVTSYFVDSRYRLSLGAKQSQIAWVHRIDGQNLVDPTMRAFLSEDWIILSLDRMEEKLVEEIIRPLGESGTLRWPRADGLGNREEDEFSGRATPLVQKELSNLGLDMDKIRALWALLQERSTIAGRLNLSVLSSRDRIHSSAKAARWISPPLRGESMFDALREKQRVIAEFDSAIRPVLQERTTMEEHLHTRSMLEVHDDRTPIGVLAALAPLAESRRAPRWAAFLLLCSARDPLTNAVLRGYSLDAVVAIATELGTKRDAPFMELANKLMAASPEELQSAARGAYRNAFPKDRAVEFRPIDRSPYSAK